MTHDGMWFFHCLQEFGIDKTNKLNKSAIKSLSSIEIHRIKDILRFNKEIINHDSFKEFFEEASKLMIPNFMNVTFKFLENDQMAWQFNQDKCFAYAGIKNWGS